MITLPDDFQLEWGTMKLDIKIHTKSERKVFEVIFADGRPRLFMSRSVIASGEKVWMSIPEGRQIEALPIGKLIVKYFQQQQNQQ
ncbi:hypothetical protein [Dyadobacter chenhuakuii]|uniref:Uncharacterized protein n=1 Tax=Dyadobacter chenhuakuii TaxID=2909339 RepID=A0A9X1QDG0_9BACT|nr:hypothetical protein [Dyadobacter chenhuakuii]MCF2498377.1 hypothetical protein [Dyadobacter chenhuakuii]